MPYHTDFEGWTSAHLFKAAQNKPYGRECQPPFPFPSALPSGLGFLRHTAHTHISPPSSSTSTLSDPARMNAHECPLLFFSP